MANVMQCRTVFTAICNGNINITVHKHSPIQCFNGFRVHSKNNVTSMSITTQKSLNVRNSPLPASQKAAHLSIICCQSTTSSSTIERVQEIIARQLSVDIATVQPQTKFSDLGADSLDTVEIVMSIEEEFGVSIPEESAENISTVQQVADLIEQQITVTV